jgi:hypothetical protein
MATTKPLQTFTSEGRMISLLQLTALGAPLSFGALENRRGTRSKGLGQNQGVGRESSTPTRTSLFRSDSHCALLVQYEATNPPQAITPHHGSLLRHWPWICNPPGELVGGAVHKGSVTHLPRWMFRSILGSANLQTTQACTEPAVMLPWVPIPMNTTCIKDSQPCVQHVRCSFGPTACSQLALCPISADCRSTAGCLS